MKNYKGLTLEQRRKREFIKYFTILSLIGFIVGLSFGLIFKETQKEELPYKFNSEAVIRLSSNKEILWETTKPFNLECEKVISYKGEKEYDYWILSSLSPNLERVAMPKLIFCNKGVCDSPKQNEEDIEIDIKNLTYFKLDVEIKDFKGSKCFQGYEPQVYWVEIRENNFIPFKGNYSCDEKGVCINAD